MKESPGQRIKPSIRRQSRPRAPPFQASNAAATKTAGKKKRFPLAKGMSQSKKELLSV